MSKQESKPVDSKVYWFMMAQRPLNYSRNKYYPMTTKDGCLYKEDSK